jgi:hypothetical protein
MAHHLPAMNIIIFPIISEWSLIYLFILGALSPPKNRFLSSVKEVEIE